MATDTRHQHAFEIYNALGNKRTYQAVATQLGVSVRTIRNWSKVHNWRSRIAERDATVARQVADQSLEANIEESVRNRKIVRLALVKLAKAIANGQIKMQLGDLDRLIKLSSFMDGYSASQTWEDLSPEQLAQRCHQAIHKLQGEAFERFKREVGRLSEESRTGRGRGGATRQISAPAEVHDAVD